MFHGNKFRLMSQKIQFPILVYHQIGQENNLDYLVVAKKMFIWQMQYISRHYHPIQLSKILEIMNQSQPIPPRTIAVTFDDGYADTFSEAFPILKYYKIPATLFITTGFIDGHTPAPYGAKMLSWNKIKEMQRSGIECGAHTVTHPNLRRLSLKKAMQEVSQSKNRLEEKLQSPVKLFAYPYGHSRSFSQSTQTLVQKAGYLGACTTLPGWNDSYTNPYELRRISFAKSQVRYFALQFSELLNGKLLPNETAQIQGVNKKAVRLWKKNYQGLGKRLKRDDFFLVNQPDPHS